MRASWRQGARPGRGRDGFGWPACVFVVAQGDVAVDLVAQIASVLAPDLCRVLAVQAGVVEPGDAAPAFVIRELALDICQALTASLALENWKVLLASTTLTCELVALTMSPP